MKKLIALIAICLSFEGFSQSQINVNGTINTFSQYRGATGPDLFMRVPVRTLDIVFHVIDSVGNLQMNPADSTLQVYTGQGFERVLTLPDANALYAPISSAVTYTAGQGINISGNIISQSKRQEVVSGTTNASGLVTITYGTAYSTTPNVQPSIVSTNPRESWMLESSSTTGCTVRVVLRTDVIGLLPSYSNVSGRTVSILVTEP